MSRGKSADRSGGSLVAEVVLIAGGHFLVGLTLASYGVMTSEASPKFVSAECAMRLAIQRQVREEPDFDPCAILGAAPLRVT